jgi:hypothetical protein
MRDTSKEKGQVRDFGRVKSIDCADAILQKKLSCSLTREHATTRAEPAMRWQKQENVFEHVRNFGQCLPPQCTETRPLLHQHNPQEASEYSERMCASGDCKSDVRVAERPALNVKPEPRVEAARALRSRPRHSLIKSTLPSICFYNDGIF